MHIVVDFAKGKQYRHYRHEFIAHWMFFFLIVGERTVAIRLLLSFEMLIQYEHTAFWNEIFLHNLQRINYRISIAHVKLKTVLDLNRILLNL